MMIGGRLLTLSITESQQTQVDARVSRQDVHLILSCSTSSTSARALTQ